MSKQEVKEWYTEQIEWHKKQIEWCNKQIEYLGRQIKDEKYDWGYSLEGQEYIRQRAKQYRDRKYHKERIAKYQKELERMTI